MKSTGTNLGQSNLARLSRDELKFGTNERKSDRTRAGQPVLLGQVCHRLGIFYPFLDLDLG